MKKSNFLLMSILLGSLLLFSCSNPLEPILPVDPAPAPGSVPEQPAPAPGAELPAPVPESVSTAGLENEAVNIQNLDVQDSVYPAEESYTSFSKILKVTVNYPAPQVYGADSLPVFDQPFNYQIKIKNIRKFLKMAHLVIKVRHECVSLSYDKKGLPEESTIVYTDAAISSKKTLTLNVSYNPPVRNTGKYQTHVTVIWQIDLPQFQQIFKSGNFLPGIQNGKINIVVFDNAQAGIFTMK